MLFRVFSLLIIAASLSGTPAWGGICEEASTPEGSDSPTVAEVQKLKHTLLVSAPSSEAYQHAIKRLEQISLDERVDAAVARAMTQSLIDVLEQYTPDREDLQKARTHLVDILGVALSHSALSTREFTQNAAQVLQLYSSEQNSLVRLAILGALFTLATQRKDFGALAGRRALVQISEAETRAEEKKIATLLLNEVAGTLLAHRLLPLLAKGHVPVHAVVKLMTPDILMPLLEFDNDLGRQRRAMDTLDTVIRELGQAGRNSGNRPLEAFLYALMTGKDDQLPQIESAFDYLVGSMDRFPLSQEANQLWVAANFIDYSEGDSTDGHDSLQSAISHAPWVRLFESALQQFGDDVVWHFDPEGQVLEGTGLWSAHLGNVEVKVVREPFYSPQLKSKVQMAIYLFVSPQHKQRAVDLMKQYAKWMHALNGLEDNTVFMSRISAEPEAEGPNQGLLKVEVYPAIIGKPDPEGTGLKWDLVTPDEKARDLMRQSVEAIHDIGEEYPLYDSPI